jgi:GTP-binding protein Era
VTLELDVPAELRRAVEATLDAIDVTDGHLALELVDEGRIRELNCDHRGKDEPTDVLSFPIDGTGPAAGPRELGDVVICPEHTADLTEAAVHGVLHLCGHDHETDEGEMLALQAEILSSLAGRDIPGREAEEMSRTYSGFIGLAGRPNVGKSTLVNAIVGAKVAIISDRPQTTRRASRGVATDIDGGWQLVLVDLPGVQRPRDVLTERMQRRVEHELEDADAVLFVVNGEQGIGPGDRFIAEHLLKAKPEVKVICAVNKIDRLNNAETAAVLAEAGELAVVDEVFPISAKRGTGVGPLISRLAELMPEGPFMYPPEERTDQPSEVHLAELIREQVLRRTREELPHAVEVAVEEIAEREDGLIEVRAQVWAETDSQKAILIGKGGRMIRDIGTAARKELERELGTQVFLDLNVRVREHWRRDEGLLDRLGID